MSNRDDDIWKKTRDAVSDYYYSHEEDKPEDDDSDDDPESGLLPEMDSSLIAERGFTWEYERGSRFVEHGRYKFTLSNEMATQWLHAAEMDSWECSFRKDNPSIVDLTIERDDLSFLATVILDHGFIDLSWEIYGSVYITMLIPVPYNWQKIIEQTTVCMVCYRSLDETELKYKIVPFLDIICKKCLRMIQQECPSCTLTNVSKVEIEKLVMESQRGVVYILQAVEFPTQYKIGKTQNLKKRLTQFKVQLPFNVVEIHRILTDDIHKTETYFHELFDHVRVRGEWFLLSEADLRLIKSQRWFMWGGEVNFRINKVGGLAPV